jgi:hypothetical protein
MQITVAITEIFRIEAGIFKIYMERPLTITGIFRIYEEVFLQK